MYVYVCVCVCVCVCDREKQSVCVCLCQEGCADAPLPDGEPSPSLIFCNMSYVLGLQPSTKEHKKTEKEREKLGGLPSIHPEAVQEVITSTDGTHARVGSKRLSMSSNLPYRNMIIITLLSGCNVSYRHINHHQFLDAPLHS